MAERVTARVLIVDDDAVMRASLTALLRSEGCAVHQAGNAAEALQALGRDAFNLVISEVQLPDSDGFELLRVLRQRHPESLTILITAYGTIDSAVDAIKLGAYDYLTKPIVPDNLHVLVQRALQHQKLLTENRSLRHQLKRHHELTGIVGQDYKMSKIFELIETVADSRVTVLVTGHSGTGKSMVARAIHRRSGRRENAFVEVNCGAIPETLLESELFGHVRGAFTGAMSDKEGKFKAADGGTLFLDEISAASPGLQIKLLRALQERQFEKVGSNDTLTVDVRLIVATNSDLEQAVQAGRFRQDLYYRINVVNIALPALADRVVDIPLLARHFLQKYRQEFGKPHMVSIDAEAMELLQRYDWPGNVRELENVIERAVVLASGPVIGLQDLPPHFREGDGVALRCSPEIQSLQKALEEPERLIIEAALKAHNWNRQATADALQINRTTLYKKMKRYGLETPATRSR